VACLRYETGSRCLLWVYSVIRDRGAGIAGCGLPRRPIDSAELTLTIAGAAGAAGGVTRMGRRDRRLKDVTIGQGVNSMGVRIERTDARPVRGGSAGQMNPIPETHPYGRLETLECGCRLGMEKEMPMQKSGVDCARGTSVTLITRIITSMLLLVHIGLVCNYSRGSG
jgi:hypothetical protein